MKKILWRNVLILSAAFGGTTFNSQEKHRGKGDVFDGYLMDFLLTFSSFVL
jgi:hypothetical protein